MLARVVVVMGVSGAGKTTIGKAVAAELGYMFQDADDLHPRANILRMHAGHPLTDADRAPWLATLVDWLHKRLGANQPAVLACSLLKRRYRDQVIGADPRVALVFLHGTPGLLHTRMRERAGHFMPPALLDSQLETLEPPDDDEHPVRIEIGGTVEDTAKAVLAALR